MSDLSMSYMVPRSCRLPKPLKIGNIYIYISVARGKVPLQALGRSVAMGGFSSTGLLWNFLDLLRKGLLNKKENSMKKLTERMFLSSVLTNVYRDEPKLGEEAWKV